jgi:hypothetical protein
MAKTFEVEVTVPEGLKEGDTFMLEVEVPAKVKGQRGQLAGIALKDMTDEQLKREIINANSVLYKAKQRGASEETIAANQARVDAAKAEQAERKGTPVEEAVDAPALEAALEGEATVDEETASEM